MKNSDLKFGDKDQINQKNLLENFNQMKLPKSKRSKEFKLIQEWYKDHTCNPNQLELF